MHSGRTPFIGRCVVAGSPIKGFLKGIGDGLRGNGRLSTQGTSGDAGPQGGKQRHALWPTVTRRPLSDDDFAFWQDSPFVAGTLDRDGQGKGNRANAPMNIVKLKTNFEIQFKVGVKLAVRPTVPNAEVASKRASIALIGWSFVARITPVAKKTTNIETVVMDKAR